MKQSIITAMVGVFVVLGYSSGNYGGGFIDSPSGLPSYFSSVTPANYGGGFVPSPPLNAGSAYEPYPYRNPRHYGGGFVQSPPIWYGYGYSPYSNFYLTFY